MTQLVSARGLGKTFGSGAAAVHALRDVDLEIAAGEFVLLMGPSGSGKTTLLSLIGGMLRPSGGTLTVAGRDFGSLDEDELCRARLADIGFVFQGFNLFPDLMAWQNVAVAFDLKGVGRRRAQRESNRLLALLGIGGKAESYPAELSGGQKQRVAIARALAGEPKLILADEPTAALDGTTGRAIMALLRDATRDRGRAVIVVTHDDRMAEYADRIVRLDDGTVRREAPPPAVHFTGPEARLYEAVPA